MQDQAASSVAEIAAGVSSKTTYLGGGASVFGMIASIDWLALAGFIIALCGFLLNAYFQIKKNRREEKESEMRQKREQEIHELELKRRKGECNVE